MATWQRVLMNDPKWRAVGKPHLSWAESKHPLVDSLPSGKDPKGHLGPSDPGGVRSTSASQGCSLDCYWLGSLDFKPLG